MDKPNILVFMSDQHTPYYSGFLGQNVETPNMDALCKTGMQFTEAYTVCPLCVPARSAMLTGLRPAKTGIFSISDAFPDTTPTFLHHLVEAGYETVLAGRMHFVGQDQRHGFTKRLCGDMTPVTWYRNNPQLAQERGVFVRTYGAKYATEVIGGGDSPVLQYDEMVVAYALEYLSQPHEKPQFLCVSLYGPHFPYVARADLFKKYLARATLPDNFEDEVCHPLLRRHVHRDVDEQTTLGAIAAYCGMIEQTDRHLGRVQQAFQKFCERQKSRRLFCYLSDHGDQCGDRKIFGKQTLFEKSAKIPLVLAGDDIIPGSRIAQPVSIMDLGPTLLEYAQAQPMEWVDGVSLYAVLSGRDKPSHTVFSEFLERSDHYQWPTSPENAQFCYGVAVRQGPYKLITYTGYEHYDMLYNIEADPYERNNLAQELPGVLNRMRKLAEKIAMPQEAVHLHKRRLRAIELLAAYDLATGKTDGSDRWHGNTAKELPPVHL